MKNKRSVYTFSLTYNPSIADNLIQEYLIKNNYKLTTKNDEQFYKVGSKMLIGVRCFNYSISGQILTIYAWGEGFFSEQPAEKNYYHINYLNTLFKSLDKASQENSRINNNMNFDPQTGRPLTNQMNFDSQTGSQLNSNDTNQYAQTFQNVAQKRKENWCEFGFWASLFVLLSSIITLVYGFLIYLILFFLAFQGLETRKRKKAIAAIVMLILSILITAFFIIVCNVGLDGNQI